MSKKEINNLIKKETKNLTEDQVKQVGELLQMLGDPKKLKNLGFEDVVKFNKEVDEFLKKYKSIKVKGRNVNINRRSLAAYIGTQKGKTILAKSGNDLSKALKSQAFKESFKTFIIQLTLSGVMVGGMGYYEYTKNDIFIFNHKLSSFDACLSKFFGNIPDSTSISCFHQFDINIHIF